MITSKNLFPSGLLSSAEDMRVSQHMPLGPLVPPLLSLRFKGDPALRLWMSPVLIWRSS